MFLKPLVFGAEATTPRAQIASIYPIAVLEKGGQSADFSRYKGSVVLVVNTASKCGFANQYDAIEKLYQKYRERGLIVLGFPSNDFMGQEPRSDGEIEAFCRVHFGVSFQLFPKAAVTGPAIQPLFKALTTQGPAELRGRVLWNFEKFLLDHEGRLIGRWRSWVNPLGKGITRAIESALFAAFSQR